MVRDREKGKKKEVKNFRSVVQKYPRKPQRKGGQRVEKNRNQGKRTRVKE